MGKGTLMEQYALQNVNNYLNTNIYSHLETSGGQSSNLYLNVVHFLNTSVNKTSVAALDSFSLNWCLKHAVLLLPGVINHSTYIF